MLPSIWLIDEKSLPMLADAARLKPEPGQRMARVYPGDRKPRTQNKIGVIPLMGLIEQRQSWFGELVGSTSTEQFAAAFDSLIADTAVSAVVIDVHSPGGTTPGVQVLSDRIFNARQKKPIYAISNSLCASAALWIASSATKLFAAPGSVTGSLGVYSVHVDATKAYADAGLNPTVITATGSPAKAEWSDMRPLSPEARAHEQREVDIIHREFVAALARNRGLNPASVQAHFGQGRTMNPTDALAARMIDGITTLDALLAEIFHGKLASNSTRAASTSTAEEWAAHEAARVAFVRSTNERLRRQYTRTTIPAAPKPRSRLCTLEGMVCPFGVMAPVTLRDGRPIREIVSANAFLDTLNSSDDVVCTLNHNYSRIIGRRSNFDVRLEWTTDGLMAEIDLDDSPENLELVKQINAGQCNGMSFTSDPDELHRYVIVDGKQARMLQRATLVEICVSTGTNPPVFPTTWCRVKD